MWRGGLQLRAESGDRGGGGEQHHPVSCVRGAIRRAASSKTGGVVVQRELSAAGMQEQDRGRGRIRRALKLFVEPSLPRTGRQNQKKRPNPG